MAPIDENLKTEIATFEKDIAYRSFSGVLRQEDDTLLTRGQGKGIKIYDELERDCHAFAVLQKRKNAVIAREYMVEPASQSSSDKRAADMVAAQLKNLSFDRTCFKLLDAVLKGYSVAEVIWNTDGREIVAERVKAKRQQRFAFGLDGKPRLITWDAPLLGTELPERKFIVHRAGAKDDDNAYGLGLGTVLFWPVFFKRKGITFWLTFADKFGSPTAVGKYPSGTSKEDRAKLLEAIEALAQDSGVTIPEGMVIEFLEASRTGSINTYESLCRYMDEQISEAVLGETLSTNIGDAGSRAASQTHNEVRVELAKGDADLLSDTLNSTLVKWLTEFNVPGANPPKVWRDFEDKDDLKERSEVDKTVFDMGFEPSEDYINATYGGDWKRRAAPPQVLSAAFAEGSSPKKDTVDVFTDRLLDEVDLGPLFAPVEKLIEEATSIEDLRDRLLEAYKGMDAAELGNLLERAFTSAELSGRFEAAKPPKDGL